MAEKVRWGILGCASIAQKVCVAIAEAANAECVAVASRDKAKAEAFAASHAPGATAYGSYEELLDDENVQVVYVPVPTGTRAEFILKAAEKKKHVLCEKPLTGTIREASGVIDACKNAGVQFMDNTMFMHNERLEAMKKVIDDQESFGSLRHVNSTFTIPFGNDESWAKDNIRLNRALEPLGALGDLGWYCARFSLWAFGYEDPESVSCHFLEETSEGVPISAAATMKFSGGRTATFHCCFKSGLRQSAEVVGTKCSLELEDFVIPASAESGKFKVKKGSISDKALTFPTEVVKEETVGYNNGQQHTRLVEKMSNIVTSGELEEFWPKVAYQTQILLGAMLLSSRRLSNWVKPREPVPLDQVKRAAQGKAIINQFLQKRDKEKTGYVSIVGGGSSGVALPGVGSKQAMGSIAGMGVIPSVGTAAGLGAIPSRGTGSSSKGTGTKGAGPAVGKSSGKGTGGGYIGKGSIGGGSIGAATQPMSPSAIISGKAKPAFVQVGTLNPTSKGFNLKAKVLSVKGSTATLGDESGIVKMAVADGEADTAKAGASLLIRNGSVEMTNGFIRVKVGKWGKLEQSSEEFTFTPNEGNDISSVEYERVLSR
eukprot:TRINITY_DN94796_c0_g1_i1.p1 TRINITY_DN94796_c0_g1~~TRINITY_DN94796_c0_g1_i1.p1  ORF type:complete len:600 (+),score=127.64 TRINITY_DN94796_c0_g1_i1:69-1868(+)